VEKALALKPDDVETLKMKESIKNEIKDLVKLYLSKGDKAMAKRDYLNAEDNYKKAANYSIGKAEADAKLKKLGSKFKGEFDAAMRKAKAALAKGDLVNARNHFRAAQAINVQDKNANAGLVQTNTKISEKIKKLNADGQSAFSADQKAKAKKSFDAVLALDATNETANDFIKRITGSVSKAKVNADEVKALYYKGVDYYVNNQVQKAIDTWKQLLEMDPNHLDAKKNMERAQTKLAALNKLKG
jgi:tetratricopeptide (TPR) repeat protein